MVPKERCGDCAWLSNELDEEGLNATFWCKKLEKDLGAVILERPACEHFEPARGGERAEWDEEFGDAGA